MKKDVFYASAPPAISLDDANEIINIDVPVSQRLLVERWVAGGRRRCAGALWTAWVLP